MTEGNRADISPGRYIACPACGKLIFEGSDEVKAHAGSKDEPSAACIRWWKRRE